MGRTFLLYPFWINYCLCTLSPRIKVIKIVHDMSMTSVRGSIFPFRGSQATLRPASIALASTAVGADSGLAAQKRIEQTHVSSGPAVVTVATASHCSPILQPSTAAAPASASALAVHSAERNCWVFGRCISYRWIRRCRGRKRHPSVPPHQPEFFPFEYMCCGSLQRNSSLLSSPSTNNLRLHLCWLS